MTIDPKTSTLRIEKFAVQVYDLNRFFAIFCDFFANFPQKTNGGGDRDIFLGPPERARAETGADQWVLKRRECSGFWDTHYQFSIKTLLSN